MIGERAETFEASLERCLESPDFFRNLHDRFPGPSDTIREKFLATDFDCQARALADSLYTMAVAARGGPERIARHDMKRLARRHQEMDIAAWRHDLRLDCAVQAARQHDPRFTPQAGRAWQGTPRPGIGYLRSETPFED